jgi:hypothetical protein
MIGAIAGDSVGSICEWHNIKTKYFELISVAVARIEVLDYEQDADRKRGILKAQSIPEAANSV